MLFDIIEAFFSGCGGKTLPSVGSIKDDSINGWDKRMEVYRINAEAYEREIKESNRRYREAHREEIKESNRRYREAHRELSRRYYEAHREELREKRRLRIKRSRLIEEEVKS